MGRTVLHMWQIKQVSDNCIQAGVAPMFRCIISRDSVMLLQEVCFQRVLMRGITKLTKRQRSTIIDDGYVAFSLEWIHIIYPSLTPSCLTMTNMA